MKRKSLFFGLTLALATVATTGFAQTVPLAPENISIDYNQHRRTSPAAARAVRSGTRNLGTSNAVSNVAWAHSDAISNLGWATADMTRATITEPWDVTVSSIADVGNTLISTVARGVVGVASLFTAPPPPMPTE
jgi:hypothetical protein